jgi:hypothetical protein
VRDILHTAGTPALKEIVLVSGGVREGLSRHEATAMEDLFGFSLMAVAAQCSSPQAAMNAARALHRPHDDLQLHGQPGPNGQAEPHFNIVATFDADILRTTLASLSAGEIQKTLVHQTSESEDKKVVAHAMYLALQKQADGRVRLSVINSNGWPMQEAGLHDRTPGVFKTLSPDEAVTAMQDPLSGRLPPRPANMYPIAWAHCGLGAPLFFWLKSVGPADAGISADFHGTGSPLVSSPQKTGDCSTEGLFAFLATVLPPADYKLAKAACLNTLVQICDQLEPPQTAPADSPLQEARRRLQERITTALSGSMVASTHPAPS